MSGDKFVVDYFITDEPCDACGALAGEPCDPFCIGVAMYEDDLKLIRKNNTN